MSEEIEYPQPPPGIRVLKNGAGYSETEKRIVHGPGTYGPNVNAITSETAPIINKERYKRTQEAIRSAILAQARESGIESIDGPETAIGHAAAVLYQEAIDPSTKTALRDRNQTIWSIAKHADLLPDQRQQATSTPGNMQINIGSDVIAAIIRATGRQMIDITPEE